MSVKWVNIAWIQVFCQTAYNGVTACIDRHFQPVQTAKDANFPRFKVGLLFCLIQITAYVWCTSHSCREWAEGVVQNYRKLPTFITAGGKSDGKDAYIVSLFIKGKKITTAAMPKLTSNCASQLKAVPCGEDILITYNSEDCLEDEENFVELTFKMPGKSLKHKFYFQVK